MSAVQADGPTCTTAGIAQKFISVLGGLLAGSVFIAYSAPHANVATSGAISALKIVSYTADVSDVQLEGAINMSLVQDHEEEPAEATPEQEDKHDEPPHPDEAGMDQHAMFAKTSEVAAEPQSAPAVLPAAMFRGQGKKTLCQCIVDGGKRPLSDIETTSEELQTWLRTMRKEMRVFVHKADDGCQRDPRVRSGNSAVRLEQTFYERLLNTRMRTDGRDEATLFYIPSFTGCWRSQRTKRPAGGKWAGIRLKQTVDKLAKSSSSELVKLQGRRHFWVSTHDMGKSEPLYRWCEPDCSKTDILAQLAAHGTCMTNTASLEEKQKKGINGFDVSQDVALICNAGPSSERRAKQAMASFNNARAPRRWSVFFAGTLDTHPVRKVIYDNLRRYRGQSGHDQRALPAHFGNLRIKVGGLKEEEYVNGLLDSDLCLAPRGTRVQSPRLIEMMWFGCVPVIVADDYKLPVSCMFDWHEMAVIVPEDQASRIGEVLKNWLRDAERLVRFRARLLRVREHFMWHRGDVEGDAFELAMLELFIKQQKGC
eukprot:TRINITY_DN42241_c0_g1_i1.p1 TRINITY_DN42241_c0_g1~~TRINITY_DN42241_c0_g1_i1.p1  ORF type:complete len:539 (+),score=85.47 TRINITY_DN42241_c0_g1_i1:112-1728(+)